MRVAARDAQLRSCHLLIERLFDCSRLVRCYTQEVDGLQTRNRADMKEVVVELHGNNLYLKCSSCNQWPQEASSVFDNALIRDGTARCSRCEILGSNSQWQRITCTNSSD